MQSTNKLGHIALYNGADWTLLPNKLVKFETNHSVLLFNDSTFFDYQYPKTDSAYTCEVRGGDQNRVIELKAKKTYSKYKLKLKGTELKIELQ